MVTEFNSQQSIHPNQNPNLHPSETKITSEPSTDLSRTAGHSSSSSGLVSDAFMGKCLSICKEPKKSFVGNSENLADTQVSSSPDRNDPSKILKTTSRVLSGIDRTNRTIGSPLALSGNAQHLGHFGVAFISTSQVDREKTNQGEQKPTLDANNAERGNHAEKETPVNEQPPITGPKNAERRAQENHCSAPPQESRDPPPSGGHSSGEEEISPQIVPENHHLSHVNSEGVEAQDNQDCDHASASVLSKLQDEENVNRSLQNEGQDTNETVWSVPPKRVETPAKLEESSQDTCRCSSLQGNESFSTWPVSESAKKSGMRYGNLHQVMEISQPHSHNIGVPTHSRNAAEIDILCPGVLDGPALKLAIPSKLQLQKSLTEPSLPAIQVVRLPSRQSCKGFDTDSFLYDVTQTSSELKEAVFEDAGQISKRSAVSLADVPSLKRLEVYDANVPLLRALTVGSCELEEVCFRGLTKDVERELCLYLIVKGGSLKSMSLNFSLSVRQADWTTEEKEFFRRMLIFLHRAVPAEMRELQTLEVSSCPSYEVKHSFDAPGSWSTTVAAEVLLCRVDAMIRKTLRPHHSKQSLMSLTEIKLRGHFSAIKSSLTTLSWVNQDSMEIEIELPGVSAIYPRGFGIMKPVALTFLQVDQFVAKGSMSPWLELTALREIDLGEATFLQQYNADISPIRTATRKLLVTSRESLSRVRVCYKIATRDVCAEIRKMLGQIIPLIPLVNHVDISRDIVLHASVEDYEYVHTVMLLRRWNLKTLQLVSSQNYGTVETGVDETESNDNRTEEFVRKLPTFLTLLAAACPRLESLVVECEEAKESWKRCDEKSGLLGGARKALEVYERIVPTVKVETLRGQLDAWDG